MAIAKDREKRVILALEKAREIEKETIYNDAELKEMNHEFKKDSGLLHKFLRLNPWYMLKKKDKGEIKEK